MLVIEYPIYRLSLFQILNKHFDLLFCVESQQRQIQKQCNPISIDQEKEGEEGMYSGFRYDVRIKSIAKVNRIDVVTAEICMSASGERKAKRECLFWKKTAGKALSTAAQLWNDQGRASLTILSHCT